MEGKPHKKTIKSVWLILLAGVILVMGQLPFVLRTFHAPPDTYYPFLDKVFPADFVYAGIIRLGMERVWQVSYPPVWEPHVPGLIYIFYLMLGKLHALIPLDSFSLFALFRVIGGLLYLSAGAMLLRQLVGPIKAKVAFVFFLITEPLPFLGMRSLLVPDVNHWLWDYFDAVRRAGMVPPHYTFGSGLAMLSLVVFLQSWTKKNAWMLALASGMFFVSGMIYAAPVIGIGVGLLAGGIGWAIYKRREVYKVMGICIYGLAGLAALLLLRMEVTKGFPWIFWHWETVFNAPEFHIFDGYLFSIGWLTPFLLLFFISIVRKRIPLEVFIAAGYGFSVLLVFPFVNLLSLSSYRLVQGSQIVGLAAVSSIGWSFWGSVKNKLVRHLRWLWLGCMFVSSLWFSGAVTYLSTERLWPYADNIYFRKSELSALSFLNQSAPKGSVVLALVNPSTYIMGFAPVHTIIGYQGVYYRRESEYDAELALTTAIFNGYTSKEAARRFILDHRVGFVYGEVLSAPGLAFYPDTLRLIYNRDGFVIYKVVAQR